MNHSVCDFAQTHNTYLISSPIGSLVLWALA